MTRTAAQFIDELDTLHVPGEEDTVSDADGNVYKMQGCACGLGLGTPQDAHRAHMLEQYVQERISGAAGNNHTGVLTRVVSQLAHLDKEMALFDAVPMHVHAILLQILTEAALDAAIPLPGQENS